MSEGKTTIGGQRRAVPGPIREGKELMERATFMPNLTLAVLRSNLVPRGADQRRAEIRRRLIDINVADAIAGEKLQRQAKVRLWPGIWEG